MLISLILAVIVGAIVAGITGIGFLFWVAAIVVFICSLPFTLIVGFFYDRATDARMDRYFDNLDRME